MKRVLIIFSVILFFVLIFSNTKLFGQETRLEMSFSGHYVYLMKIYNENVGDPHIIIDTVAKILMDGSFNRIKDYQEAQAGLIKTFETEEPTVVILQDSISLKFSWLTGMIMIENFAKKALIFISDEIVVSETIPIESSIYADWISYSILIFLVLILFLFSRACKHRNWNWIFQKGDYIIYHKLLSWIFVGAWACLFIASVFVLTLYLFVDLHSSFYTATFLIVYITFSSLGILITAGVLITYWIRKKISKYSIPESSKYYVDPILHYSFAIAVFSLPLILIDFWTLAFPVVLISIGVIIRAKYKNII